MRGLVADEKAVGEGGATAVAGKPYRAAACVPAWCAVGEESRRPNRNRRCRHPNCGASLPSVLPDLRVGAEGRVLQAVGEEVAVVHIDAFHGAGVDAGAGERGIAGNKIGVGVAVDEAAVEIRLRSRAAGQPDSAAVSGVLIIGGRLIPHAVAEEAAVAEDDVRPAALVDAATVGTGEANILEDVRRIGYVGGDAEDVFEGGAVLGVQRRLAGRVEGGVVSAGEAAFNRNRLGERNLGCNIVFAGFEKNRVAIDGGRDRRRERHRRIPRKASTLLCDFCAYNAISLSLNDWN